MKTSNKLIVILALTLALVIAGFIAWGKLAGGFQKLFGREEIVSEVSVKDIQLTEKMKVLTIYKEVMVNFYKESKGLIGKNQSQICTIYPARLDFGFDLSGADEEWIKQVGDSVIVTLPPISILNKDNVSIDDASKRVVTEKGDWTIAEKSRLRDWAAATMLRSCEADSCWNMAAEQGIIVVKNLVESFGLQNVRVSITPSESPNLYMPPSRKDNPFTLNKATDSSNEYYFEYENSARLDTEGNFTPEQLLAISDLFRMLKKGERCSLEKDGNNIKLSFAHDVVTTEFPDREAYVKVIKNKILKDAVGATIIELGPQDEVLAQQSISF